MATSVYVGPNNKKLGIHQYQYFVGEYPQHVSAALSANPALANFFMPADEFAKMRAPGTPTPSASPKQTPRLGPPIKNY
jgi:hypothetical protein